ncbi:hypothetical protein MHU86_5260 [Fragilaria crotonensis]|nr:hypothetical protein MHU86_18852 [Fragilaria crotonensis]KAI2509141.1 hypothetical protein MHU86_5260 [Fragilaria crotonensis]
MADFVPFHQGRGRGRRGHDGGRFGGEITVIILEDVKVEEVAEEEEEAATMATDPTTPTSRITRPIGRIRSRNWGKRLQIQYHSQFKDVVMGNLMLYTNELQSTKSSQETRLTCFYAVAIFNHFGTLRTFILSLSHQSIAPLDPFGNIMLV